ncbi:MAG: DNA mismatch repair endonuclease MutL [Candidatus Kapaibacteriales bacterium]
MVENSFDAGASTVTVVVKKSGKSLIHIIDDGSGIPSDSLPLTTKRHSTSKITSQSELESISSYGFRGEALASISSVADLQIITNTSDNPEKGLSLSSKPNQKQVIEPFACAKGTQIIVRELFSNVPARRKFLRTDLTEFRHISDTMVKSALSNYEKRVIFYDNDTLIFDSKSKTLIDTISETLGKGYSRQLIEIKAENNQSSHFSPKVYGFISELNASRSTKTNQYVFLNRRAIKNKSIAHAVHSAYEPYLSKGQYPSYIIFLEIDFSKVDINVHPQKHEVKFENEKAVYDTVLTAIRRTLDSSGVINSFSGEHNSPISINQFDRPHKILDTKDGPALVNVQTGEIIEAKSQEWGREFKSRQRPFSANDRKFESWDQSIQSENRRTNELVKGGKTVADLLYSESQDSGSSLLSSGYLIVDSVFAVSTKERVKLYNLSSIYETFLKSELLSEKSVTKQDFMFPLEINLNGENQDKAKNLSDTLESLSFSTEYSERSLSITSKPEFLPDSIDLEYCLKEALASQQSISKEFVATIIAKLGNRKRSFDSYEIKTCISFKQTNPDLNLSPSGKKLKLDLSRAEFNSLLPF